MLLVDCGTSMRLNRTSTEVKMRPKDGGPANRKRRHNDGRGHGHHGVFHMCLIALEPGWDKRRASVLDGKAGADSCTFTLSGRWPLMCLARVTS